LGQGPVRISLKTINSSRNSRLPTALNPRRMRIQPSDDVFDINGTSQILSVVGLHQKILSHLDCIAKQSVYPNLRKLQLPRLPAAQRKDRLHTGHTEPDLNALRLISIRAETFTKTRSYVSHGYKQLVSSDILGQAASLHCHSSSVILLQPPSRL